MDALTALQTSTTWRTAWTRYREAHPEESPGEARTSFQTAAMVGLVWSELEIYLDAALALHRLQAQAEDTQAARALALDLVRSASQGELEPGESRGKKRGEGPDLASQRLKAFADVDRGAIAHAMAADKLRSSLDRYQRALVNRIELTQEMVRDPSSLDHALAERFARVGDLDRLRPLVHALRSQRYGSGAVLVAADELATARARAERAEQLRARALTVGESIAAENELSAAVAEVRAIERRETGDGEDALAAGLAHVEAMAARDRLP